MDIFLLPMQVRMNDVKLDDKPKFLTEDPTDESHAISCEDNMETLINITLELKGGNIIFPHKEEEQYLQFWATLDDGQVWSSKISAY